MSQLRIAFVTLGFEPFRTSGLDISGERLVRGLLEAGHHVTVIAGAHNTFVESRAHPRLQICRVPIGASNWIGFAFRAAQLLNSLRRDRSFDIVHFWDVQFAYAYRGLFVASLQQSFRQRWGIWEQSREWSVSRTYRYAYYSLARIFAETPSLRRAKGLLAGSSATRDEFIQRYGISPNRISLVRHGIDSDIFRPNHEAARALRSKFGLGASEPVILFVGFVTPRKGLEYLARALPLMNPMPRLVIVGRWSKTFRSHFLNLLGPAASCVVEAGFVPDEQMPAYYSLADVYVSPSLLEGFGIPMAEALSCETPVVAANAGAAAEVVGPGGLLVAPRDSVALATATSRLLENATLRLELGKKGREHVGHEFSIQTMLSETVSAYRRFSSVSG